PRVRRPGSMRWRPCGTSDRRSGSSRTPPCSPTTPRSFPVGSSPTQGGPMSLTDAILKEFEMECATTRRVLERVPDDRLTWKPHPKSMSLGELALHLASSPGAIGEWGLVDTMDFRRCRQLPAGSRNG